MALATLSSSIRFLRLHPFPPSHIPQPLVSSELLSLLGRLWWFLSGHPTALLSPQPRLLILLLGPRQCLSGTWVLVPRGHCSPPLSLPHCFFFLHDLYSVPSAWNAVPFPASPTHSPALSLALPPSGGLGEVPIPLSHVQGCILCVFL